MRHLKSVVKPISLIICDDFRREVSGKEILVGVFSEAAIVESFPTTIGPIVFRIGARFESEAPKVLEFVIKNEKDGSTLDPMIAE